MSITGDTVPQALFLYGVTGDPVNYATKAAFLADGWALTWYDKNDVVLASQPTYALDVGDVNGRHLVSFIKPADAFTVKVTRPSILHGHTPLEFDGEGLPYDDRTIGSLIVAASGLPVSNDSTSSTAEVFHGDSLRFDFSVTENALVRIGAANLAACTMAAEIKRTSIDSSTAADVATLIETIISDISGTRTVRGSLDAFPAILAPPTGGQTTLSCRADLRLTNGAKTITAATIAVTVKWKATT